MFQIPPIKLLSGTHEDTAQTGSGCFMNVIAYLNGEPQITDNSPCVCPSIRPIAIWLNDHAVPIGYGERLLPFVLRAMGTATEDPQVLSRRMALVVQFANDMAEIANEIAANTQAAEAARSAWAARAAEAAAQSAEAAWSAKAAARSAAEAAVVAEWAARAAEWAAEAAAQSAWSAAWTQKVILERGIAFLDAICPQVEEPSQVVIERAHKLYKTAHV